MVVVMTFIAKEKVFCFLFFLQLDPVQGQDCVSLASSDVGRSLCDSVLHTLGIFEARRPVALRLGFSAVSACLDSGRAFRAVY